MGMCDENFLDFAHLYMAFLDLMLSSLSTVKEPDSAPKVQGQSRMVSR